ncbi:MAG: hypothetical protein IID44_26585 [Planctomycetes bacterium]|nr:hypothetical protein [Planctomycetota bacterium]
MKRILTFLRDTRHLLVLLLLIAAGGAGFMHLRGGMIPESFGRIGPYRAAALDEIAARPSVIMADSTCLKCHADVGEERADTLHTAVGCIHCHGLGRQHVAEARRAVDSPDVEISPAKGWDGNFRTDIDLYITKDRATCLACHQKVVGMPKEFKKIKGVPREFKWINVDEHLEDEEAEEPESRETCFECHEGHNTEP